ncbi:hypothetical protein ACHAXT_007845 [Thalassiosira profunda]
MIPSSTTSWSWRHRFYAFLLRRALGPFLTPQSAADLQSSIEAIDFTEGKFALVDVELDPAYLTSAIQGRKDGAPEEDGQGGKSAARNIAVQRARIRRLAIQLSVRDVDSRGPKGEGTSSARKATSALLQNMCGAARSDEEGGNATGIALVAHVELEGLDVVLAPGRTSAKNEMEWSTEAYQPAHQPLTPRSVEEQDASAPGFFSSLVDSAMKSLRLSIDVSDVNIRVCSHYCSSSLNDTELVGNNVGEAEEGCWIALRLPSVRYYDLIDSQSAETGPSDNRIPDRGTREKVTISKALEWEGFVVDTGGSTVGSPTPESLSPIFKSSGGGQLRFRVFEKWSEGTAGSKPVFLSARQHIDVSLGQSMAVECDICSMARVIDIANAVATYGEEDGDFVDAYDDDTSQTHEEAPVVANAQLEQSLALADEFSRETYEEIMKQYTEARHLARTNELRGGLLVPSFDERGASNDTAEGDISFDAFFDANDNSVSHYRSIMDDGGNEGGDAEGEKRHRSLEQTKIELGLEEFTVKVHLRSPTTASAASIDQDRQPEYILLSFGYLRVIKFGTEGESKVNCSVSHFDVESQVSGSDGAIINEPLLRFVDDPNGGSEVLVSSPPCISMMAEFSRADGDDGQASQFDVVLQPLEVLYREKAIRRVSDVLAAMPPIDSSAPGEEQDTAPRSAHLSLSSTSIVLMAPCQHPSQMPGDGKPNPLFQRHGYTDQGSGTGKFSGIGIELEHVGINLSRKTPGTDGAGESSEESKTTMACARMVLFAKGTELQRGGGRRRNRKFASYSSRRADIVALTRDEECETSVTISFTSTQPTSQPAQSQKRKSAFPLILPLSSTKARQEMDESDEDEMDPLYDDGDPVESSDPQYILSSEANRATRELVIDVPYVFFDSTTLERQALSDLLSSVRAGDTESEASEKVEVDRSTDTSPLRDMGLLGVALNVGQASVVLHGSETNDSNSYSLVLDKMQVHALIGNSGVRNVRFLSHDVTLYELSGLCSSPRADATNKCPTSCAERCKQVQGRLARGPSTVARAILFRQKLCQSLSPETPALLVDVLLRGDDDCEEKSVHMHVFDMTCRYAMNSNWAQNITDLIKGEQNGAQSDTQTSTEEAPLEKTKAIETSSSLTNLFVNLSDCNFDYTPPQTYSHPSRVIFRMGEIRFSSNIVTPAAAVQAYKLSLSDLRLHICNYRHSYNEENSFLSCAHRHLSTDDLFVPDAAKCLGRNVVNLDDALCRMDFVNVVVLDTLDAIIFKSNYATNTRRHNDPATTVALTLGKMSVYACHDSFSCLNQTYNEWFIKTSVLSEDEIERLRALSETDSEVGVSNDASYGESECLLPIEQQSSQAPHAGREAVAAPKAAQKSTLAQINEPLSPTPQHQHRDDTVSLDLTKSLLFQNYYTFDAKNNQTERRSGADAPIIRRQEDDSTLRSASSEDEWAAVEHDYQRHSNIPRERDQSTGWILCDSPGAEGAAEALPVQSQTVKVYPQHIPVKPVLDPFAEGTLDTAKLAGTDVAPDIGLRVIVKDGSITFRFFDGFDWVKDAPQFHNKPKETKKDRKAELLGDLLGGDEPSNALDISPLPEERHKSLQRDIAQKKLRRNAHRYFQISMHGLKMKQDSFADSKEHRLASCLDLSISDFFIAETISMGDPVKMMGEWVNESEHPRDSDDGVIMLKMVTKHPKLRVSSDGKLMSDESRASLELLPLRCYFNQNALRFVRNFFAGRIGEAAAEEQSEEEESDDDVAPDEEIINIFFESFKVRPCKLKVDYQPENMDVDSLRDGNYVEILNLCPLEEMILSLQPVEMQALTGWGSVLSELGGRWIEDICATQAHKFFTRASPLQPFSNLSDPLADLALVLVIPEGGVGNYVKGIIGGTTKLAGKVALEALTTSAKLTRYAARKALPSTSLKSSLPRRPRSVPRHAGDAAGHAYESVASGLREANYKIVTVPLREYQNTGAGGAARSALRGIPIGIIAPLAGASEALSYTLLGLRNQLMPDIRKEEEASLRGLNYD